MNVLVVGAGMLALVYGGHLARAGHRVSFLVRTPRPSLPVRMEGVIPRRSFVIESPQYVTAITDVPAPPDYSLLCVPSDPLDLGLIDRLAASLPARCTLVSFTPGFEDADQIVERVGLRRSLFGMPSTQAMEEDGAVRFWLPGFAPTRLGPHPREREADSPLRDAGRTLALALADAGVPARYDRDTVTINRVMTASFAPVGALFRAHPGDLSAALADRALVAQVCLAVRETTDAAAALWGEAHAPVLASRLVRPLTLRAFGAVLKRTQPAAFRFAQKHFTKINAQNAVMMRALLAMGQARGVAMPEFAALVERYASV